MPALKTYMFTCLKLFLQYDFKNIYIYMNIHTYIIMQDEVIRLSTLQPQIEKLNSQSKALKEKQQGPMFLEADLVAFTNHFKQVYDDVKAREKQLQTSTCYC